MTDANITGPMLAADGTPLKRSLARALRRQKLRALALIAPLLLFILITFIAPIADMLLRSVENQIVADTLPATVHELHRWDAEITELPDDATFNAMYMDIYIAQEAKAHTRLGTRLNYELTGMSSLFRKSGRGVTKFPTDAIEEALTGALPDLKTGAGWVALEGRTDLPLTAQTLARWSAVLHDDGKTLEKARPEALLFTMLAKDLRDSATAPDGLAEAKAAIESVPPMSAKEAFAAIDKDWVNPAVWSTIKANAPAYTPGYFLNAVDLKNTAQGIEQRPEDERIYIRLFIRTAMLSLAITGMCILLGYPVAWLLANLPRRTSNVLMILVLLPFWTSLLVRTSAWKVLLQQQGVINDILVWIGLVADDSRLVMINNVTGTIIAMTHILLPFMILPLYSVMQTIAPTYLRAAKSLGATNWTAFWRVYFPQSVPGIGAGSILVFILSIGYYITPELVGGTKGVFISNRIAYHISSSLNWGLAAALGAILLAAVLLLYWVYDRIVGIDNVKLG